MIDREIVEKGLAALSVAAGELLEDHQDELVTLPKAKAQRQKRFMTLGELGADLVAIASAASVLVRRGE